MKPDKKEPQLNGGGQVTFTGLHHLEDRSPRSNNAAQAGVAMTWAPASSHAVYLYDKQPYLDTDFSPNATQAYANFVYGASTLDPSEEESVKPPPVAIPLLTAGRMPSGEYNSSFPLDLVSAGASALPEKIKIELATLFRRELGSKYCSRSSELLTAVTSTVQDAAQEHGPSGMSSLPISSGDDDEDTEEEALEQDQVCDHERDQLRAAICNHPLLSEMVFAHIRILKIGAPSELLVKLDDVTKKFERFDEADHTSKLGQDPELDFYMKSYVVMLTSLRDDLEEPFNKFMQFIEKTTKDLEALCGPSYVEMKAEADQVNYGFDIGPIIEPGAVQAESGDGQEIDLGEEMINFKHPTDIDESIVVDPDASQEELKKALKMKYGRHILELMAEFNRDRKKGKLPSEARKILKDWFNNHSYWPYPTELEKATLQQLCGLNLKQINNWFVNERKRHWGSEERKV